MVSTTNKAHIVNYQIISQLSTGVLFDIFSAGKTRWCSLFNSDLALSITMTAISTVLSIVMLPINLLIYTSVSYDGGIVKKLDWLALLLSLFIVISAILLGMFSSYKLNNNKNFRRWANILGNLAGIGLMIFSGTVANNGETSDSKIWSRSWQFYVGVALPCVLGLLITNLIATFAKLKPPERVTVSIECCYQNVGIATSVGTYSVAANSDDTTVVVNY